MKIVLSGTPGTGKTTLATIVAKKLKIELIEIRKIVEENKIRERGGQVDIKKLKKAVASYLKGKESYVIEGHLACEIKIPADRIFVTRTQPKALEGRLIKRKYGRIKRRENIEAEVLDYCTQRVILNYGVEPLEIDTSKRSISESAKSVINAIKHKKKKLDNVHYNLEEYLRGSHA